MTDEETPELGNAEAPEGTPEPSVDDGLPDKWKGKSASEIARAHEELERKIGEQGRQFGEYKTAYEQAQSELAYYRNAPRQPQTQQPAVEDLDDEFFKSPTKTIDSYFNKKLQEYEVQKRYADGDREFPRTLAEIRRMEPDVFGDPEIEQGTRQFVEYGVKAGKLDPMLKADSNSLIAIGVHLKYLKDKKNPARHPVSPTQTETPAAVRTNEPTAKHVEFSDKDKDLIAYLAERAPDLGIKSEKDAAKLLNEESD